MKSTGAIARYEAAAALLPPRWRKAAAWLEDHQKSRAEEFRLRVGHRPTVLLPEGELTLPVFDGTGSVTQDDLEQMVGSLTDYSRYACAETLRQGYLAVSGGFRLGLCGTAVIRDGKNSALRDISSLALRIVCEHPGIAHAAIPQLYANGRFCSTLLLSPPGGGKTTFLRDIVRELSMGASDRSALRVGVVDERGEIAVCASGIPQMDLGPHTDILDGCPKALGIFMLLRAMNPQVIAVDEITAPEDIEAMLQASNCGVAILATIHAATREELEKKPLYIQLKAANLFTKIVEIVHGQTDRHYHVRSF